MGQPENLHRALTLWKYGYDCKSTHLLDNVKEYSLQTHDSALAASKALASMSQFFEASELILKAVQILGDDWRLYTLLANIYHGKLRNCDQALWALEQGLACGLKSSHPIVKHVLELGLQCGRTASVMRITGDSLGTDYIHQMAARIKIEELSHFQSKWDRDGKGSHPVISDIVRAKKAGDSSYAKYLYQAAANSDEISEQDLIEIAYLGCPDPKAIELSTHMSWRLLDKAPLSSYAQLRLIGQWLRSGDLKHAGTVLKRVISETSLTPITHGHELLIYAALSCSMYGLLDAAAVIELIGRNWSKINNKELSILVSNYACKHCKRPSPKIKPFKRPRPKIAFCLSGQLRNYRKAWQYTQRALCSYDVTVFLFTWSTTGVGFGSGKQAGSVSRRLPVYSRSTIPSKYTDIGFFSARYPHAYAYLCGESVVTGETCTQFYKTDQVIVEHESDFDSRHDSEPGLLCRGSLNSAKMFYGIYRVMQLVKEYERFNELKFDAVIRARPDNPLIHLGESDIYRASRESIMLVEQMGTRLAALSDTFFVLPSTLAPFIGNIWPKIEQTKTIKIVPGASGGWAERALFESVAWNGIPCRPLRNVKRGGLLSLEVEASTLWDRLRQDMIDDIKTCRRKLDEADLLISTSLYKEAGLGCMTSLQDLRNKLITG